MKKFVVIGHVDTGKSTLCGHLLYKCGVFNDHDLKKSGSFSGLMDIYEEEARRGKTFEFSEIEFKFKDSMYKLYDTPGHKGFIRSMIQGVSQDINIAVLMVSCIDNEFKSSFTNGLLKEHLIIAKTYNVRHLIVLFNKIDINPLNDKKLNSVKAFLKIINWEKNVHFLSVSAFTGEGMDLFFDTIEKIDPTRKKQLLESKNTDTILCEVKIAMFGFNGKEDNIQLITSGYNFNYHIGTDEGEGVINKINKQFLRNLDSGKMVIKLDKKINVRICQNILLRKNDFTVGFGKIINCN
jgi:small GTP-binding protein